MVGGAHWHVEGDWVSEGPGEQTLLQNEVSKPWQICDIIAARGKELGTC